MKKEILIGFAIGLVATAFGFYLYIEFASKYSFDETLKILMKAICMGKCWVWLLFLICWCFLFF